MSEKRDSYFTIKKASEGYTKDRGSKFFAYAYPNYCENDLKLILEKIRNKHHTAKHHCYAYRYKQDYSVYRVIDDGEPKNAAGKPILGQIDKKDLTNVVVVVVRYFGGTKLGVSGMMNAYKDAALIALNNAEIVEITIDDIFQVDFCYPQMNRVMRIIKEHQLTILSQKLELKGQIVFSIRKKDSQNTLNAFTGLKNIYIKQINED